MSSHITRVNINICKFGMCIDIVEIWFWIANVQTSLIFDRVIRLPHVRISFADNNWSKYEWIFAKFGMCRDIV